MMFMYLRSGFDVLTNAPKKQNRSGCDQPVPIVDCLRDLPVGARAAQLADLNRQIQELLPPAMAGHIVLADIHADRAIFLAKSSAWATRARLQDEQLRQNLQALGQQVRSIHVKVVQPERTPRTTPVRKPLTASAAEHLRSVAASTSDPELRAQFLALASLADNSPD